MYNLENNWVDEYLRSIVAGKKKKRPIQFGIDHLPGKKLYKYYSFSSEHTIKNLKNDIIYLQNPVVFNDPFDCNIGISVNQLFRMLLPNQFDEVFKGTNSFVNDYLWSGLLGNQTYEMPGNSQEKIVSLLLNSQPFMELVHKALNGETISDQDYLSAALSDPDTATDVLKTYLLSVSNGEPISFDDVVIQNIVKSPQIMKGFINRIVGSKSEKEKKIIDILNSEEDFVRKTEAMASLFDIDVPRDKIETLYGELDSGIKKLRNTLGQTIGIECLTLSPTDVLMWSNYANKHTGICVEYDFSKLFSTLSDTLLLPVIYSENRPLLNVENVYDSILKQVDSQKVKEELPNIIRSIITKSLDWEREKEWRIVSLSIKTEVDRSAKMPIISRIITGINISDNDFAAVKEIAHEKHIPINRTRLNNEKYKIEIID